jgi:hypothetical protein
MNLSKAAQKEQSV